MADFTETQNQVEEAARKLLLARAQRLREKPVEQEEGLFWTAEFPLGGEAHALPLECLVACLPLKLVTPVPLCDSHLTGIVRYQRLILTVLSLSGLLGSKGWRRDPSVMLVLKLGPDRLVAVDCEEIPRGASLSLKAVEEARAEGPSKGVLSINRPGLSPLHLIEINNLFMSSTGAGHAT